MKDHDQDLIKLLTVQTVLLLSILIGFILGLILYCIF